MFADGLEEFDDAREVVTNMIDEYKASERPDYVTWGKNRTEGNKGPGTIAP